MTTNGRRSPGFSFGLEEALSLLFLSVGRYERSQRAVPAGLSNLEIGPAGPVARAVSAIILTNRAKPSAAWTRLADHHHRFTGV